MQVQKQKVRVRIEAESFIVEGTIYTMVNGRLSDYITSQKSKFIPVTGAVLQYLGRSRKILTKDKIEREVVLVNVDKIEMIEYL